MKIKCSGCGAEHWMSDMQLTDSGCNVVCPNCSTTNYVNSSMVDPKSLDPRWYYAVGDETVGPLSTRDLEFSFQNGQLAQDSFVWCDGLSDWMAMSAVPELLYLFSPVQGNAVVDEATRVAGASGFGGYPIPSAGNGEETAAIDLSEWNAQQDIFNNDSNGIVGMDGREAQDDEPVFDMGAGQAQSDNEAAGARSENSVLFSLSSLQSMGTSFSGGGSDSSSSMGGGMAPAGGAGLVDVKALASAPASRRRTNEVVDSFGGTAVPMATILPLGNKKDNTPLYIGLACGGAAILVIIILLIVLVAKDDGGSNNAPQQAPVDANQMLAKDDGLGLDVAAKQNKKEEEEAAAAKKKAEEEAAAAKKKAEEEEAAAAKKKAEEAEDTEEEAEEEAPAKKDTAKKDTATAKKDTAKKDTTTTKKDTTATAKADTAKKDTAKKDTKKDTKKETAAAAPAPAANALTKAEISAAMRGVGGQLRTCGRTAAQNGTMKVSFVIKGNGSVSNAKCTTPEFANTPTAACVLKVINGVKFRATGGNDIPINNYPVAIQK